MQLSIYLHFMPLLRACRNRLEGHHDSSETSVSTVAPDRYFDYYRNMKSKDVVAALAALAHESRLAVFRALVEAGPPGISAGQLSTSLDVPASSMSFHLKELTHAGLIENRHEGRYVIYTARFENMNALLGYLTAICCGGNPCSPLAAVLSSSKASQ